MRHRASRSFWARFSALPEDVQALARAKYRLLRMDPMHPSLHFKPVKRYWSVRVGQHYRAVGQPVPEGIVWFWIGTHAEYTTLLGRA